jgi:hypothetical protein
MFYDCEKRGKLKQDRKKKGSTPYPYIFGAFSVQRRLTQNMEGVHPNCTQPLNRPNIQMASCTAALCI